MARRKLNVFGIAMLTLAVNLLYALYNGILGVTTRSWWFIFAGAYYIILSVMRFAVVRCGYGGRKSETGYFIMRFSGVLFLLLSLILAATVYMAVKDKRGTQYHEIVMITIAVYTFTKITLAIINFVKSGKQNLPLVVTLRSISVADGAVSLFSMQRSMLASFGEMASRDIFLFNLLTGMGVCLVVVGLGIYMIRKDYKNGKIKACKNE